MNDDNSTPLTVSVVMCTYNGKQFLREQMDSILAQDYPLHEIIVQDDRSTDDTWDILQTYAKAHPGLFKLFRNDEQLGFNRNFHTALLRATGQYVAISDQDDIWFPQKISKQVAAIGNADLCFSDYYTDLHYTLPLHNYVSPRTDFEHMLFYDCTPGHSMLLRTDFVKGIKLWNYDIYYDWWLSMHAQWGTAWSRWTKRSTGTATTMVRPPRTSIAKAFTRLCHTPHGNPMHGAHCTGCTCSASATTASSTPTLHSTSTAASTPCRHA